jgi:hypothetical protein
MISSSLRIKVLLPIRSSTQYLAIWELLSGEICDFTGKKYIEIYGSIGFHGVEG